MKDFFQDLRKQLMPTQWASWQTLLLLSGFSALMASPMAVDKNPAGAAMQMVVSGCGWIFLILGVWWFTAEKPIKETLTVNGLFLGPWIVAALVTAFLYSSLKLLSVPVAVIFWPPLAALIAISGRFIKSNPDDKTPEFTWPEVKFRQEMVLLVLSYCVIACWLQFYFLLQGWLGEYPSLMAQRFEESAFVVELGNPEKDYSRGRDVLKTAEDQLTNQFRKTSWPEVEKWLLEMNRNLPALEDTVKQTLNQRTRLEENNLWALRGQVTGGEYDVELRAVWQGPSAKSTGYYISKTCQISPETVFERPEVLTFKDGFKNGALPIVKPPTMRVIGKVKCGPASLPKFDLKPGDQGVGV
jgi:Family of unknown function (DUF5357)